MKIERWDIDRVTPYPGNPRQNDDAIDTVAASLREFGFRQPIVVDTEGTIIAGHTRWRAALKLGLKQVPVHVAKDLSSEQVRAYRLADNQTASLATWDYDLLPVELAALKAADYDLDLLGFDPDELARLLDPTLKDGLTDPDQVPEPPDDAITQPGDLWVLGNHRLLCGDSSKPADVDRLLGGASIHLVNTDPPYNVRVEPRSNNAIAAGLSSFAGTTHHQQLDVERHPGKARPTGKKLRAKDRPLANDFVSDAEFDALLDAWFGNMARVLEPGRGFYIWGGYANLGNYPPFLKKHGLYFSQGIVWDKQHPVLTRKDFMGAFEIAFYGWKEGAAHLFLGPNNATDLWHVKKVPPQRMQHLCLHPEALVLTQAGYRPIQSIAVGTKVLAGDGTFRRVEHVSTHPYTTPYLYRITAKGGNATTDASDNHPFLIWRPVKRGRRIIGGDVAWLRADQIQRGDYTLTPILQDAQADPLATMDEQECFFLGLLGAWLAADKRLAPICLSRPRRKRLAIRPCFCEEGQQARRGSPLRLQYQGRPYALRYVKKVERVPYQGEVWNLSIEGHPTFQTSVGLSHNTEKPVELAVRALQYSSRPGEHVLDLFGGSGSTLIAAEQTGRKAFLMELDGLYADVIVRRWEQFTGRKAERIAAGDPAE